MKFNLVLCFLSASASVVVSDFFHHGRPVVPPMLNPLHHHMMMMQKHTMHHNMFLPPPIMHMHMPKHLMKPMFKVPHKPLWKLPPMKLPPKFPQKSPREPFIQKKPNKFLKPGFKKPAIKNAFKPTIRLNMKRYSYKPQQMPKPRFAPPKSQWPVFRTPKMPRRPILPRPQPRVPTEIPAYRQPVQQTSPRVPSYRPIPPRLEPRVPTETPVYRQPVQQIHPPVPSYRPISHRPQPRVPTAVPAYRQPVRPTPFRPSRQQPPSPQLREAPPVMRESIVTPPQPATPSVPAGPQSSSYRAWRYNYDDDDDDDDDDLYDDYYESFFDDDDDYYFYGNRRNDDDDDNGYKNRFTSRPYSRNGNSGRNRYSYYNDDFNNNDDDYKRYETNRNNFDGGKRIITLQSSQGSMSGRINNNGDGSSAKSFTRNNDNGNGSFAKSLTSRNNDMIDYKGDRQYDRNGFNADFSVYTSRPFNNQGLNAENNDKRDNYVNYNSDRNHLNRNS
ncbi:putative uncharacterized protein DDB_G0277255 [Mya arenaria]|uniref:putative uncharacterized protein DDB_G0277255 n=1 Tax=Mya arenaria TaxID=6604 RepID=UPI0022E46BC2|nr:putative uncharacterized protein DDB_G0277255 [Mya arenaria]